MSKTMYTDLLIAAIKVAESEAKFGTIQNKKEWKTLLKECKRELYELDKKIVKILDNKNSDKYNGKEHIH